MSFATGETSTRKVQLHGFYNFSDIPEDHTDGAVIYSKVHGSYICINARWYEVNDNTAMNATLRFQLAALAEKRKVNGNRVSSHEVEDIIVEYNLVHKYARGTLEPVSSNMNVLSWIDVTAGEKVVPEPKEVIPIEKYLEIKGFGEF
jgi:hypothetical protein